MNPDLSGCPGLLIDTSGITGQMFSDTKTKTEKTRLTFQAKDVKLILMIICVSVYSVGLLLSKSHIPPVNNNVFKKIRNVGVFNYKLNVLK